MTKTISEVSSNCWKLVWIVVCEGSKWLREHQHVLFFIFSILYFWLGFFFTSYPKLVQNGKHPPTCSKGCTSDTQAASAPSWSGWWFDSGLMPFRTFHQMESLDMYRHGPKISCLLQTCHLQDGLFASTPRVKNQAELSLRWTLLGHNALGFCAAEPCNESQGWC